jgi:hypothetical protein
MKGIKDNKIKKSQLEDLELELEKARSEFVTTYQDYLPLEKQDRILKDYIIPTERELMISAINSKSIVSGEKAWNEATKLKNFISSRKELAELDKDMLIEKSELDLIKAYADSYQKEFFKSEDLINIIGEYEDRPSVEGIVSDKENLVVHDEYHLEYDEPHSDDAGDLIYDITSFDEYWKKTIFYYENQLFYELILPSTSSTDKIKHKPLSDDICDVYERRLPISKYDVFTLIDNTQKAKQVSLETHNLDQIYPCKLQRMNNFCSARTRYTSQKIYTIKRQSGRGHCIKGFKSLLSERGSDFNARQTTYTTFGILKSAEDKGDDMCRICLSDPTGTYTVNIPNKNLSSKIGRLCAFTIDFPEGSTTWKARSLNIYPVNEHTIYGDINKETECINFLTN